MMRNLLLTTDFSLNASGAAAFAAQVAYRIGMRLVILHALPPVVKLKGGEGLIENVFTEDAAQKKLDKLAYELRNKYNISVSRLLIPGFAADEIAALAKRLDAALVIMGTQGESPGVENTLGSVAIEVLEKCKSPVVCVPHCYPFDFTSQMACILNRRHQLCNSTGASFLTELVADSAQRKGF